MSNNEVKLDKLEIIKALSKVQKAESKAKSERIKLEQQLAEIYISEIDSDAKSKTFSDVEGFKVTVSKGKENYSLDQEKYAQQRLLITPEMRPEKVKFEIDLKGYEWLRENNKAIYDVVSPCVTMKIGKASVKVEKK